MKIRNFWSKVDKNKDCWIWTGSTDRGYGKTTIINGEQWAHRIAYSLYSKKDIKGLVVRHKCDVSLCCNPEHMITGTQLENIQDRQSRERQARGETVNTAKLTKEEVKSYRRRHKLGEPISKLSRETSVSYRNFYKMIIGETWRHV